MKHIFKKMSNSDSLIHFLIPESFSERSTGIKIYQWMNSDTVMLFKSPCILHTFGLNITIKIQEYSKKIEPIKKPILVEPNSIIFCYSRNSWIGESFIPTKLNNMQKLNFPSARISKKFSLMRFKFQIISIATTLIAYAFLVWGHTEAIASPASIKMQVGTSKEVVLNQAPRSLNISNPDVIDVQRIGLSNKILVTALSSGEAVLIAQYPNSSEKRWSFAVGSATVQEKLVERLSSASLIRTAKDLQKKTGLDVTIDSGTIAIFGHLSNATQAKALIETCLGLTECQPRFSMSEVALAFMVESLSQYSAQLEFTDIKLIPSFGGIIVKGTVPKESDRNDLIKLIRSVVPKPFEQLMVEKASQELIETQLSFFRVSETGLTAMGISSTIDPQTKAEGALATISVPNSAGKLKGGPLLNFALPTIMLKALSKKGIIKQISQPTLIVASGGRGEISSGGELLFQSGGQVQKFLTQNYGITVALQPRLIGKNKIVQRVDLKITHPQSDPTQSALSSLTSSTLTTEVSSEPEQQILLTRISQQATGKSVSKVPIIGHIPILGELFKTRELSGEDAELWITLKSKLVQSVAPVLEPMREGKDIDPNFGLLD
ncbi:MAG: hypothetical protein RJB13_2393 [Pseudomonadota bacterium]